MKKSGRMRISLFITLGLLVVFNAARALTIQDIIKSQNYGQVLGASTPAFVQGIGGTSFSSASNTITFSSNITSGDVIAVGVGWYSGTVTLTSLSASCVSGTFTLVNNPTINTGNSQAAMGYAVVNSTGPCSLTASFSGSVTSSMVADEISNVNTGSLLDGSAMLLNGSPGTGTDSAISGNITTTANADYLFGFGYDSLITGITWTAGSNYTLHSTPGSARAQSEGAVQSAAGPATFSSFTITPGYASPIVGIMAFKSSSGGSGGGSAPTISSFSSSPTTINSGQSSTLTWSVSGAASVSIDNGLGSQSGSSVSVSPTQTITYTLTAANNSGSATSQATVNVNSVTDTTAPSTPTNLSATAVSPYGINLSWNVSTDNIGVTGYKIYRGGTQISTSATNSYSDTGLSASTSYSYSISAYDAAGNNSPQSTAVNVMTQAAQQSGSYPWSGILDSTRATDWSQSGVPGGIPNRTTICATINAATYGSDNVDATTVIQNALNNCPANEVVMIPSGKYLIDGSISVPSYVTLRGAGADQTILDARGTGSAVVSLGSSPWPSAGGISIINGATAGSASFTVSSASGITTGSYLMITELNDPSFVTINGTEGSCTWCDGGLWNGARARGQIVDVNSVSGNTVTFTPPLYSAYSHTPLATPIIMGAVYAGVENLQVYANNTGYTSNFLMQSTADSWLKGVEGNYADGDQAEAYWSYRGEIRDSYFSNAYSHGPGSTDADVFLVDKTTGFLVENNILERLHISILTNWGAAGNVIAYNYSTANFDSGGGAPLVGNYMSHGAHPQFNLWEGNIGGSFYPDSVWGSSSHNTFFRNWALGTSLYANPLTGRGTIQWSSSYWSNQANRAMQIAQYSTYYNLVGNVVGSAQVASQMPEMQQVISPTTRAYDGTAYDYTFGYGELADGSGNCSASSTCLPYTTVFIHGDYSNASNSTTWANGVTQNLPASLFLPAKPSWWGSSVPWPAIGPDVTGGIGPGSHAYANPAEACYSSTPKVSSGMISFNASNCYPGDYSGNSGSAPSISSFFASPSTITYGGSTILSWSVSGATSLSIDNSIGTVTPSTGSGSTTVHPTVTTTYTLTATNSSGSVTSQVTVTVNPAPDTTAPTATITSPSSGTVSGSITFSASASDPTVTGQVTSGLKLVTLSVDGSVFATSTTGTISKSLDTTTLTNTSHTLTAQATDNAGNNSTIATVTITVNNAQATKYPRTITLTSLEGISSISQYPNITATILSPSSGTTLETQTNLTADKSARYTVTFLSSDPQLVNIRIKVNGYLSQLLTNIDTTVNSSIALSVPQLQAGDFNNDNIVNSLDYSLMNNHWLQNFPTSDINTDGLINSLDFAILKNNYNKSGQ